MKVKRNTPDPKEQMLIEIEKHGSRARGYCETKKHLGGEILTQRQAILSKCYDCMGFYADGAADCDISTCSLHPFMVYNKEGQRKTRKGRTMTEEEKRVVGERFAKARLAKL